MHTSIFILLITLLISCSHQAKEKWKLNCVQELDRKEVDQVFKTDPGTFHREDSVIFQKVLSILRTESKESTQFEFYFRKTSKKKKNIVIYGISNKKELNAITCGLTKADFSKETEAIIFVFAEDSEESKFEYLPIGFRINY
jgi:hypothetical protein